MPNLPKTYNPRGTKQERTRAYDKARGTRTERGYTNTWLRYSKSYLLANPLCVECMKQGRTTPATCVDHIEPHRGDPVKFVDESNHQSLCSSCHSAKTGRGQ